MTDKEIAGVWAAFHRAAEAVAALRVPVRGGQATPEDLRRHAARTAARFYLSTVARRTRRAGPPDDGPQAPARERSTGRRRQDDARGG